METSVKKSKANYKEVIREVLKELEGPLTYQDIENIVVPSPTHQRLFLMAIGTDEGKDVAQIMISVSITSDNKVKIEKNNTDLNLRDVLLERGVPYSDIIR